MHVGDLIMFNGRMLALILEDHKKQYFTIVYASNSGDFRILRGITTMPVDKVIQHAD